MIDITSILIVIIISVIISVSIIIISISSVIGVMAIIFVKGKVRLLAKVSTCSFAGRAMERL